MKNDSFQNLCVYHFGIRWDLNHLDLTYEQVKRDLLNSSSSL